GRLPSIAPTSVFAAGFRKHSRAGKRMFRAYSRCSCRRLPSRSLARRSGHWRQKRKRRVRLLESTVSARTKGGATAEGKRCRRKQNSKRSLGFARHDNGLFGHSEPSRGIFCYFIAVDLVGRDSASRAGALCEGWSSRLRGASPYQI